MSIQVDYHHDPAADPALRAFADAVIDGLSRRQKSLPTSYLYDARGSELFEEITELDEYYQTRTELAILEASAPAWTSQLAPGTVLVEFGSGSSLKTEILLSNPSGITDYAPIDVSPAALDGAVARLRERFPAIVIHPLVGDFNTIELPAALRKRPKASFFPGSTIGNFTPADARELMRAFARLLGPGSQLLIGADLRKDHDRLVAAYDDRKGVTAAFNLNLLRRINRELDADFDLDAFRHLALYNARHGRIEMHLVSLRRQDVTVAGEQFSFAEGEGIHTENSHKYTIEGFRAFAAETGWQPCDVWTDPEELFSVHALRTEG